MTDVVAPALTDGVVVLGAHRPEDAAALVAGEDEAMARGFGWHPRRSSYEDAARAIEAWRTGWLTDGSVRCFAVRDTAGVLVGTCEVRADGDGRANISWSTLAPHRRRGFAVRAGTLVIQWAFGEFGVERLEARVAPDNEASLAVARRLSFREEGVLRSWARTAQGRRDMILLARLRSDGD